MAATLLLVAALAAACGPHDRLRDNYWGKSGTYEPVDRDAYGDPVMEEDGA